MVEEELTSSFFTTEFPEEFGPKELFEIFKDFGLVVEVVIPPRRDKRGKWFRFVRFQKVRDEIILYVKLDNIYLNGKKIYANIPKFHRREVRAEILSNPTRIHRTTNDYAKGAN